MIPDFEIAATVSKIKAKSKDTEEGESIKVQPNLVTRLLRNLPEYKANPYKYNLDRFAEKLTGKS